MSSSSCTVSMMTITILATLCGAAHPSPVVSSLQSGESAAQRQPANLMLPANGAVAPIPMAQGDIRNPALTRNILQDDTQPRSKFASQAPSQLPSVQQAASRDSSFNPPASMILPSWPQAQPPSVSQPRDTVYGQAFNDKLADNPDRLVEGSGAGPPPAGGKNQKVKLDDTEESEDDDEEDYDDKDPAEGKPIHIAITTQKPTLASGTPPDTIRKPAYNDFYNPFRPAATNSMVPGGNLNYFLNQTTRPTASPPSLAPQPANVTPTLPLTTAKRPSGYPTSAINEPNHVPPSSSNKNKTETDYDYEDENVDDELEETSVFEDNDTSDIDTPSNKSHARPASPNQLATGRANNTNFELPKVTNYRPPTTNSNIANSSNAQSVPPKQDVARPNPQQPFRPPPPPPPAVGSNSAVTSRPYVAKETTPTNLGAAGGTGGDDEEDEEDEEEVEEEEEEEEEDEDPDMGDGTSDNDGLPEYKGPPIAGWPASKANSTTLNPPNSQIRPVASDRPSMMAVQPVNTHEQAIPPAMPPPSQRHEPSGRYSSPIRPVVPMTPTVDPIAPTSTPLAPVNVPSATTTTATPTTRPTMSGPLDQQFGFMNPMRLPTTVATIIAATPSTPQAPTTPPPATRAPPPYAPAYYPTTIRPYLVSTHSSTRRVVAPPIVTTTNIQPYSNTDDSLTRQIYDKAVEAYHEANKTMRAAVEAVWPPNFDFDYRTLEPLLAQPIFFMLALGGAIICLVLLMMLIVYMISYQTKPRRYEHDDISIY